MARYPDWPQRLSRAIEVRLHTPYAWGALDCALCTADLVASVTGQDFGAPFRGRYSDEAGANAILKALGHDDLASFVSSCLPRGEGRPRRGDVVMEPRPGGDFLGVVWAGGVIGPGPRGLVLVPRTPDAIFWRVG
jgi:hypothetical protein